jgi:hypothetical protein
MSVIAAIASFVIGEHFVHPEESLDDVPHKVAA